MQTSMYIVPPNTEIRSSICQQIPGENGSRANIFWNTLIKIFKKANSCQTLLGKKNISWCHSSKLSKYPLFD